MEDPEELSRELNRTFYHGLLPHADIDPLLRDEGDFVVRKTDRNGCIHELIKWHMTSKAPISASSSAKLLKGITRQAWLLDHDEIQLQKKLGEGAFGEVYLAQYISANKTFTVAVKTMREEVSRQARLKFMKEARIMRKFTHPNIVKIIGIVVYENPLMIVMELCPGGSVLSYLRKNSPVGLDVKLRFCLEASAGLAYLESMNCIHRQVPMKWLAPETMQQRIFSSKTDVWSYGVLVWEVYGNGKEPYPGLSNIQTRAKIVVQNYRMQMPKDTPPRVSKLIYQCWKMEPNERPSFAEINEQLRAIVKKP